MEYVSVKIPKDKSRYVKLLKAEKIRSGDFNATDAEVLGDALEFSFEHEHEFVSRSKKGNIGDVLKLAGSWKLSDEEAERLIKELREWRKSWRSFVW